MDVVVDDLPPGNLLAGEDGHCAGNQEYTCYLYHQPSIISTFLHAPMLINACASKAVEHYPELYEGTELAPILFTLSDIKS